jgi:oligoribonuclease
MAAARSPSNLVWLDLETTGLDVRSSAILEIATVVTDKDLNVLAEGPDLVIQCSEDDLLKLDPWCARQHRESGLLTEVQRSKVSLAEAEARTLAFVRKHCLTDTAPLCGNSICFDRRFLMWHMPRLNGYLNFRNVDVSSIKELVHRWYPGIVGKLEKRSTHRALDDVRESIEELRLYRSLVFKEAV